MRQLLALALLAGVFAALTSLHVAAAPSDEQKAAKEKLRELGDFIGGWKGSGSTKEKPGPKDKTFEETVSWGWKIKGDDMWLVVEFKNGGVFKDGEMRWDGKSKAYKLTLTPLEGKDKLIFEGKYNEEKALLTMSRTDPSTKEVQTLKMSTAAEGIRLNYRVEKQLNAKALAKLEYKCEAQKIGESLSKKEKGPECVVSGGRGTTQVSYMGKTYYVCCSGCADAFKENPKKYVDEFEKNKKK